MDAGEVIPRIEVKREGDRTVWLIIGGAAALLGWLRTRATKSATAIASIPTTLGALYESTGRKYGVDPALLGAIAWVESRENPHAINKNTNGTVDRGLMQINDTVRKEFGATADSLFDPAVSLDLAARLLARNAKSLAVTDRASVAHLIADRKSTRLNSSHSSVSRMPSSA